MNMNDLKFKRECVTQLQHYEIFIMFYYSSISLFSTNKTLKVNRHNKQ